MRAAVLNPRHRISDTARSTFGRQRAGKFAGPSLSARHAAFPKAYFPSLRTKSATPSLTLDNHDEDDARHEKDGTVRGGVLCRGMQGRDKGVGRHGP